MWSLGSKQRLVNMTFQPCWGRAVGDKRLCATETPPQFNTCREALVGYASQRISTTPSEQYYNLCLGLNHVP